MTHIGSVGSWLYVCTQGRGVGGRRDDDVENKLLTANPKAVSGGGCKSRCDVSIYFQIAGAPMGEERRGM